ncbi:hypothetical protein PYCC9005_001467 [Savitreella phatthalungensis]
MPPRTAAPSVPLPKSYRRKYMKLMSRFVSSQRSVETVAETLERSQETALRLEAELNYLLDTLYELDARKYDEVLELSKLDKIIQRDASMAEVDGASLKDLETPAYFSDLPWNLDRDAMTGSFLEDSKLFAAMQAASDGSSRPSDAIATTQASATASSATPVATTSTRKRDRNGSPAIEIDHSSKKRRS